MNVSFLLLLAPLFVDDLTEPTDGPVVELPSDAVMVVVYTGQSNTFGTNSLVTDVGFTSDYDPDLLIDCFIWDQIKRKSQLSMSMTDPDRGGEPHQFRKLTRGYGRSSALYPWENMSPALSIGAEMQLAYRLREQFRRPVYIVKCARGSTPLYQVADRREGYPFPAPPLPELPNESFNWDWNRASDSDGGGGLGAGRYSMFKLWRDYYWKGALQALLEEVDGDRSRIYLAGVVHFQGAADSKPAPKAGMWSPGRAAANAFDANLAQLLDGFRDVISPGQPLRVPLVVCRSEDYFDANGDPDAGHPYIDQVRAAQRSVQSATPNSALVSTDGLERPDGEHFNAPSQQLLANRIFNALLEVRWMRGPYGD